MFYSPVSTKHGNTFWCSKFYQSTSCNQIIIIIVLRPCGSDIVCSSENPLSPSFSFPALSQASCFCWDLIVVQKIQFLQIGEQAPVRQRLQQAVSRQRNSDEMETAWLRENTFGDTFRICFAEGKYFWRNIWNSLDRGEIHLEFPWQRRNTFSVTKHKESRMQVSVWPVFFKTFLFTASVLSLVKSFAKLCWRLQR